MMENTKLIDSLAKLRPQYEGSPSDIEIIRYAVYEKLERATGIEMPKLLTEPQRKVFLDNIDHLSAFLASEDGADSVELLMDAFARFTEQARTLPPDDECDEVVEADEADELEDGEDEEGEK